MNSAGKKPYGPVFLLLFSLLLIFACSTPSWFPLKKGPPHKAKTKELVDKEVIIIDRHEYVKVLNPRTSEGGSQPKYLYIPVEEYLAKREAYTASTPRVEPKRVPLDESRSTSPPPSLEREVPSTSLVVAPGLSLRKKVLIAHFDDRTTSMEETLGDWLAERLMKDMAKRSSQILFVDYQMVKEFLAKRGASLSVGELPKVSKMLNEIFGVHAIVMGELSGPYVFTTKGVKNQEEASTAIIKIETKLIHTLSGAILQSLSSQNPIVPTKERGLFSDEKAKERAFDITLSDLSQSLLREFNRLDWFCRVAKIEGEEVYLNAGKLSGLKTGDVMVVLHPKQTGQKEEIKGKVQIITTFGIDASIGKSIQGQKPDEEDILKLAERQGS